MQWPQCWAGWALTGSELIVERGAWSWAFVVKGAFYRTPRADPPRAINSLLLRAMRAVRRRETAWGTGCAMLITCERGAVPVDICQIGL